MMRRFLLEEPELVAYGLLGSTIVLSWAAERFAPSVSQHFYRLAADPDNAQTLVDEIARELDMSMRVRARVAYSEKHVSSVAGGIIFVPDSLTQKGRRRVHLALDKLGMSRQDALDSNLWIGDLPISKAEAKLCVKAEMMHLRDRHAEKEYLSQLAVLGSVGLGVMFLKQMGRSNIFLAVSPLIGALAVQKTASAANTAAVYQQLTHEERTDMRRLLEAEAQNNRNQRRFGISSSGNDWFDVARPLLSTRIKMLSQMD